MDTSEVSVSRENSYAYTVNLKPIEDGVTNSFLKKCRYPIDPECTCEACRNYSRGYIRHLFKAKEMLALRLCVLHNLYFYNKLMEDIRAAIDNGTYSEFKEQKLKAWNIKK